MVGHIQGFNIMKKIIPIILFQILCVSHLCNAQEMSINHNFWLYAGVGMSSYFNNSGITMIDVPMDRYSGSYMTANIGWRCLALDMYISNINMRYDKSLQESNTTGGVGVVSYLPVWKRENHLSLDYLICIGILFADSRIYYDRIQFPTIERYGIYEKFGISLEYEFCSKFSVGILSSLCFGNLKDKDLPKEIIAYQSNHTNSISNYSGALIFKAKF